MPYPVLDAGLATGVSAAARAIARPIAVYLSLSPDSAHTHRSHS